MTENTSPENLRKFLESDDPAMVRMGLSMAKGVDLPKELLPTILRFYMWDDDKSVRNAARTLFFKHASDALQNSVKKYWKPMYRTLSREPNTWEPLDYEKYVGPYGREDYDVSIEEARGQGYRKSTFKLLEVVRKLIKKFDDNDEFVRTALYPFTKNLHNDCIIDLEYDSVGLWIRKLDGYYHVSSYNYQNEIAVDALGVLEDKRAVPFLEAVKGQKMEHMNKRSFDKFQTRIEQSLSKINTTRSIFKPVWDEEVKIYLDENPWSTAREVCDAIRNGPSTSTVYRIAREKNLKLKVIERKLKPVWDTPEILNTSYKKNEYDVLTTKNKIMNLDVKDFGKVLDNIDLTKIEPSLTAKKLISLTKESAQIRWLIACHLIALDKINNLNHTDPISDGRKSEIQDIEKIMSYNLSNYEVTITKNKRDEILKVLKLLPVYLAVLIGAFLYNFAMKSFKGKYASDALKKNRMMIITIFEDVDLAKILLEKLE